MSFSFDLFLSYEKELVKELRVLHEKLATSPYNFKIWRDETNLDKSSQQCLADQIADGIKKSHVFLCFLTKKYEMSDECKNEIIYARVLKKTIVMLKIENLISEQSCIIGYILANSVCIECKHTDEWHDPSVIAKHVKNNMQVF